MKNTARPNHSKNMLPFLSPPWKLTNRRLNMELDFQSLFGSMYECTHWLRSRAETPKLHPPAFGLTYEGAIGQPR